ncbi:MAG: HPr family phosphocarrier protein [Bacteroidetes bacterium]|nr:HPr family phosphocarrier protein [Bacteroidota bacterium]
MIIKEYTILAQEGMHARPATALVKLARGFVSKVLVRKGEKEVKLSSLLNVLSMGVQGGDTITVMIDGEDEGKAAEAIDAFFHEGLKDW